MKLSLSQAGRAWLSPVLEDFKPLAKEAAAISFFINFLGLAAPIFVMQIYDRVVFRAGISTLTGLTIGMIIVCGFEFILRQARAKLLQRVALKIDVTITRALFDKMLSVPLPVLEGRPASYWKLLFRDVDVVRNCLSGATATLAVDAPFAILFLLLIFVIAWPVAGVLLLILAAFIILSWRTGDTVGHAAERETSAAVSRDATLEEILSSRVAVKALALGPRMKDMWESVQRDAITHAMNRGGRADNAANVGQTLTVAATVAMTVVGALAIIEKTMTIGGLIAANMLAARLLAPMNQMIGAWRTYAAFRQSVDRLAEAFAFQDDVVQSAVSLPRPKGRITLEKVDFGYVGQPVIENLDVAIEPASITTIMGLNGSGKTTLLKLMLGLYRPVQGRVLLDGADIAQFSRDDLARWIGYVPQEPVLLTGTIRDNIAYGRVGASDDDIIRAAKLAQAHEAVIGLPQGYGTPVGEAGARLSGGLRQRISIARALLGDPAVIVMDEPTSSLDREAEEGLKDALLTLSATHTIVLVTHSPTLIQACHKLIVMEAGRITAQGPPSVLRAALAKHRAAAGTPNSQLPQSA